VREMMMAEEKANIRPSRFLPESLGLKNRDTKFIAEHMSSPALRDEPYGNGPSRLSAREGPNGSTPAGSAGSRGDAVRPRPRALRR
jgi:hypothetical protein